MPAMGARQRPVPANFFTAAQSSYKVAAKGWASDSAKKPPNPSLGKGLIIPPEWRVNLATGRRNRRGQGIRHIAGLQEKTFGFLDAGKLLRGTLELHPPSRSRR